MKNYKLLFVLGTLTASRLTDQDSMVKVLRGRRKTVSFINFFRRF